MTNSFLLKMAIEIVRFPRYKMVISRRCLYVYQSVVAFPVTYQTGEDARNSSMKIWEKTHYREVGRLDVIFQSGALHLEDMQGQTVFYIWGFPKLGGAQK